MDSVVHFEIPVQDMLKSQAFFEGVFGWKVNLVPQFEYAMLHTMEVDEQMMPKKAGAINGGMMKQIDPIKSPVITIQVESIDASAKKIEKAGGKMVVGKQPVGDMGFSAYFLDISGNLLGLWENAKK
jgi:predicted enzyme related to lactoylglutathione lyase